MTAASLPILIGWALLAVAAAHLALDPARTVFGWGAAACSMFCVSAVINDRPISASVNAALTAVGLWWWWNSGGGDDTRRRLRQWARTFHGVRRTAPAGGTA